MYATCRLDSLRRRGGSRYHHSKGNQTLAQAFRCYVNLPDAGDLLACLEYVAAWFIWVLNKGLSRFLSSGSEIEINLRIEIADILNNFAQPLLILGKFTLVDILSDEIA